MKWAIVSAKVNLSVGIIASLASKILAAACHCGQRYPGWIFQLFFCRKAQTMVYMMSNAL